ncbi:MAG: DUF4864 domain-containing protein [Burkholderiaceae bacterium]
MSLRAAVSSLLLMAALFASSAHALPRAELKQIRSVITDQLDALARNDASRAFAHTSPLLQEKIGTPANFLDMIKNTYGVIYRHVSVQFLQQSEQNAAVYQYVQLSDEMGRVWMARYRMLKTAKNRWTIDGCELEQTDFTVV